eukprot:scaffold2523_cov366-Prasinococcus_capsulatus_cf.AAC.4
MGRTVPVYAARRRRLPGSSPARASLGASPALCTQRPGQRSRTYAGMRLPPFAEHRGAHLLNPVACFTNPIVLARKHVKQTDKTLGRVGVQCHSMGGHVRQHGQAVRVKVDIS